MTKASKETYADPDNQIKFESHRAKCSRGLEGEPVGLTFRELAAKIGLKPEQVWKRLSELLRDDKVFIFGPKIENGNVNSLFKLSREPELFPLPKRKTLRQWLAEKHPDVWQEWEKIKLIFILIFLLYL